MSAYAQAPNADSKPGYAAASTDLAFRRVPPRPPVEAAGPGLDETGTVTPTMFLYASVSAGALLALWIHARRGRSPKSFVGVTVHLLVSLLLLELAVVLIDRFGGTDLSRGEAVAGVLLFFLPAITYVFIAAIFLLIRLQQLLSLR